jgi:hypothetical protein
MKNKNQKKLKKTEKLTMWQLANKFWESQVNDDKFTKDLKVFMLKNKFDENEAEYFCLCFEKYVSFRTLVPKLTFKD